MKSIKESLAEHFVSMRNRRSEKNTFLTPKGNKCLHFRLCFEDGFAPITHLRIDNLTIDQASKIIRVLNTFEEVKYND